jgi:hypothetical protein
MFTIGWTTPASRSSLTVARSRMPDRGPGLRPSPGESRWTTGSWTGCLEYELGARPLDLIIFSIAFGFSLKFNLSSLIAIVVAYIYSLKYYFVWR